MKRLLCLLLAAVLLCGCGGPAAPTETVRAEPTEPTVTTEPLYSPEIQYLRENLPVMDGSTSLIPLEAGIRAAIFGISQEEATTQVVHSTTWDSFFNLLNERADLIFTCPMSQEQRAIAAEQGVALEMAPIAMEGFVFVVNGENPVDSLTQTQLRQIYSGKITNWKDVGGNDEPIIAYQRNSDSGSQNHMVEFMGSSDPLMDAPVELRPATMEGLMDVVAVNDNAAGAIGYSVYSYASDMYANGDKIKFLQIEGVGPSKQTFADRTYPLLSRNYAVFRADEPQDSPVRRLVQWLSSFDGQMAVAKAGYVTMEDMGFDYAEMTFTPWSGVGKGPAAHAPGSCEYTLTQIVTDQWGENASEYLPVQVVDGVLQVEGLGDPELQGAVNRFLAGQVDWTGQAHGEFAAWLGRQGEYGMYSDRMPYWMDGFLPTDLGYTCLLTASNGYLSAAVTVLGSVERGEGEPIFYRTETATWDLLTGEQLEPEALFCQGVDVDAVLNEYVRRYSQMPVDSWSTYLQMKQDFAALPEHGWHLTHDALYIDMDNPYFVTGVRIPLDDLPDGILAAHGSRAFAGAWTGEGVLYHGGFRITDRDVRYEYNEDSLVSCGLLKEEVHPNAEVINKDVLDYLNSHYTRAAIADWYMDRGVSAENVEMWMLDWSLSNLGGRYLLYQGARPYHMAGEGEEQVIYGHSPVLLFDLETGERMDWRSLLHPGWEAAAEVVRHPGEEQVPLPEGELGLNNIYFRETGSMQVVLLAQDGSYTITIPWNYVNYKG